MKHTMKNKLRLPVALILMLSAGTITVLAQKSENVTQCGSDCTGTCVYSNAPGDPDVNGNCHALTDSCYCS